MTETNEEPAESAEPTKPVEEEEAQDEAEPARSRAERYAPYVVGVLLALPTLLAYYPPMSDLPLHEGVVGVLRHFSDESYYPRGLYTLNLGHHNQLFHLVSALLSFLVGTRWAVKIVIAAAQLLMFHAGARLADHLGRSRWSVLLLAPLALGFTYFWGLVANILGHVAFLYALPALDRAAQKPSLRSALVASAAFVGLSLAHGSVYVIGVFAYALFAVVYPLEPKKTALRATPLAFAAVFSAIHVIIEQRHFAAGQIVHDAVFFTAYERVYSFANVIFGSHELFAQLLLLALSVIAVVGLAAGRYRESRLPPVAAAERPSAPDEAFGAGKLARWRETAHRYRFEIVAATLFLGYWVMPFNWRGATLLHERFLGPAWGLIVLCVAGRREAHKLVRVAVAVVPAAILLVSWPQFLDSDGMHRDLDSLLAEVPMKSAIALCGVDSKVDKIRIYAPSPGPARALAVRGGRIGNSILQSPISPVQVDTPYRWDEFDVRIYSSGGCSFEPSHDLDRFGYIIMMTPDPRMQYVVKLAFAPDATFVTSRGNWMLFRSTHQVAPLLSADVPSPPNVPNVLDRIELVIRREVARIEAAQRAKGGQPSPPGAAPGPTSAPSPSPSPSASP